MPKPRLLLLSNSKNYGQAYLDHAEAEIKDFFGSEIQRILFVPFAAVRLSYDDFTGLVRKRLKRMGYAVDGLHKARDPERAVREAEAIAVGGGNTFHLLRGLYEAGVIETIRARVAAGMPYIGWSAGSNVACPTIRTTNDMPIVEPPQFAALNLVPFQINPHYTDFHPPGHQGETREERLLEFAFANPTVTVVGLREGCLLRVEGKRLRLIGDKPARLFRCGIEPREYAGERSLQFLLDEINR